MYHIKNLNDLQRANSLVKQDPHSFWLSLANEGFQWTQTPTKTLEGDFKSLPVKWFADGKLNITENCLDRHLKTRGQQVAIHWEPNDPQETTRTLTYQELFENVCQTAHALKSLGIKKGDRVCFYMSMVPELLIGVLACARIGAVHSVVFGGFSAKSLAERIQDAGAKILFTNDGVHRGNKLIELKAICDEALLTCPTITHLIVHQRTQNKIQWNQQRDLWWHETISKFPKIIPAEIMNAEDPLFILYTSGSTGRPKGLLHTCGGYMVWAGYTFKNIFQMQEKDIFWCTADIGWITGHTYIAYGPLINGTTQVMFEGIPTYPDASRFWKVIEKFKVSHFYTAPTAIRALQAQGDSFVKNNDLSSLKVLGSVGEPINEEAWNWYNENIGKSKCPLVDTWWQTETGGIMISAMAGITPCISTFATLPLPGVSPILVDEVGKEITSIEAQGNLCLDRPWPGIARTIFGDHQRYQQTYFSTYPGRYFTGDGARRDASGNYRITGRVDDVLNVSGHRIGTAEVENALNQHPNVVESAVVGTPHDIKGQGIYAFVLTTQDNPNLEKELNAIIMKEIGAIARPDMIQVVNGLPKTRSGKIMRRILRKLVEKEFNSLGDTSTLLDPGIVEEIKKGLKN